MNVHEGPKMVLSTQLALVASPPCIRLVWRELEVAACNCFLVLRRGRISIISSSEVNIVVKEEEEELMRETDPAASRVDHVGYAATCFLDINGLPRGHSFVFERVFIRQPCQPRLNHHLGLNTYPLQRPIVPFPYLVNPSTTRPRRSSCPPSPRPPTSSHCTNPLKLQSLCRRRHQSEPPPIALPTSQLEWVPRLYSLRRWRRTRMFRAFRRRHSY